MKYNKKSQYCGMMHVVSLRKLLRGKKMKGKKKKKMDKGKREGRGERRGEKTIRKIAPEACPWLRSKLPNIPWTSILAQKYLPAQSFHPTQNDPKHISHSFLSGELTVGQGHLCCRSRHSGLHNYDRFVAANNILVALSLCVCAYRVWKCRRKYRTITDIQQRQRFR